MLIVSGGKCPPSHYEVDVAAYDIAPSKEITRLTDADHEQLSAPQKQWGKKKKKKKLRFLACMTSLTIVEKLIIKYCVYINLSSSSG